MRVLTAMAVVGFTVAAPGAAQAQASGPRRQAEQSAPKDEALPRLQMDEMRGARIGPVRGGAIGLLAGAAVGVIHGALDHPGLPHHGSDLPNTLEYSPFFAVAGLITGVVLASR
jgi:hypothetical protein